MNESIEAFTGCSCVFNLLASYDVREPLITICACMCTDVENAICIYVLHNRIFAKILNCNKLTYMFNESLN